MTAEGQLFSYICSKTGRAYDLTEYVNDINRQYVETLTAYTINSGATESYSYAGNQRLSRNNIWNEAQGVRCNQTSYYLYDGRGSVTANTWYNGMVTDVYQYDPYGQVELGSTKHTDFYGYNAESCNPNSGLEFLRARYYNANQGRFFQEDTYLGDIIDPLTLNRYAYVKNSPMNYVDPSGHVPIETVIDILSIGWSATDFTANPSWANAGFLIWDIAAAFIPYAPGSYTKKGVKVISKADNLTDAEKAAKAIDNVSDLVRTEKKLETTKEAAEALLKNKDEIIMIWDDI